MARKKGRNKGCNKGCKKNNNCPKKRLCRKGYTTKRGTKVESECIINRGEPGRAKEVFRKIKKVDLKCPKGKIPRAAYVRKTYSRKAHTRILKNGTKIRIPAVKINQKYIKAACTKNMGKPGRDTRPKLPEIRRLLKDFGYSTKEDDQKRQLAIKKAIRKYNVRTIIWHLSLIRNYVKLSQPRNYKIYTKDMEYAQSILRK